MNTYDAKLWEKCKLMAERLGVKFEITSWIELTDVSGRFLACCDTSEQVYWFLCGYGYFLKLKKVD